MKNLKKLPNILTSIRLLLTPIIVILGLTNHFKWVLVLGIIASITDFFDGYFARKFNAVSKTGAKLDAVSDKVFAIAVLLSLLNYRLSFLTLGIFECFLGCFNLYCYYQTKIVKSLMVGKVKTVSLFTTIILAYAHIFFPDITLITKFLNGFIMVSLNLQLLSFIAYLSYFLDNKKQKPKPVVLEKKEVEEDKTIPLDCLDELLKYEDDII